MGGLETFQYILIAVIFVWSGFVRAGLGFGGSVLALPFLLLVHNAPLVFLPLIAVHLLFFSTLTVGINARKQRHDTLSGTVDWRFLGHILPIVILPKLVGVLGLITLPAQTLSAIIYTIVAVYALGYLLNRPFRSQSRAMDVIFLILGGYISGTSLIGAPFIIAVAIRHVARERMRDTLFVLWFLLVAVKMAAFVYAGVDLQLIHNLWLLPCAAVGHVLGLRFHDYLLKAETPRFFQVIGGALFVISLVGLWSIVGA